MSSISANQRVSKRSLTLNKSFLLSIFFHTVLIFGVTFTTFYKIPLIDESPIINVKFANSSQDSIGELNESANNTLESNNSKEGASIKKTERKISKSNFNERYSGKYNNSLKIKNSILGSGGQLPSDLEALVISGILIFPELIQKHFEILESFKIEKFAIR